MKRYELFDLIDFYLLESKGDRWHFRQWTEYRDQRFGQAFFNSLNDEDKARIKGTSFDTFFVDDKNATEQILRTLDFLTTK